MSRAREFWLGLVALLALCAAALVLSSCASLPPSLREVATEAGAKDAGMAACALAHGFDGKVPEAEAVTRWCAKAEFAKPWEELARQAAALVDAQRSGKVRPEGP